MLRLLPLLLLLAACAAPAPPPPPPQPLPYPVAARERLLRLALEEWREWGCRVTGEIGEPAAGPCLPAYPARESDPESFPRVLAYWRSVPDAGDAIPRNRALYAGALRGEASPLWAEPYWSAAFISWLIGAAGVDSVEFAPSASHSRYLDHLDAVFAAYPTLAAFVPRDPAAYAPRTGDLLCRDRSRNALPYWGLRASERGQFRPMHCDVVVATAPGVVEAVGGNVEDAVTLVRVPADAAGRVLPNPRPALVIMENRLGRLPPWNQENRS
ncbi:DUF2272 domain-containing protein [Sabulicella rubraurantiaca]|uniref:DUF2272 domain-containing protein n=1 Tax=Sabulicella rubraurantiaca TaxID=2811429 RepID=UPI001A964955|nr:DUF2272 domain-containing protein [Sabulicella rubraurantiaca]